MRAAQGAEADCKESVQERKGDDAGSEDNQVVSGRGVNVEVSSVKTPASAFLVTPRPCTPTKQLTHFLE